MIIKSLILKKKLKFSIISVFISSLAFAQHDHTLWYNAPASNWNEALPIGNGAIGAMIFGGAANDKIQLNEETVWAGEPGNNIPTNNPAQIIQQINQLLFAGKYQEAQELSLTSFPKQTPADTNYGMPYQPVGNLNIITNHQNVQNYKRTLNIQDAIATTSYTYNQVNYKKEYFVSFPQKVMVIHLSADQLNKINFKIALDSDQKTYQLRQEKKLLLLEGKGGDDSNKKGKIKYEIAVLPIIKGGKIIQSNDSFEIKNATEATLFISIASNFKNYKDLSNDYHQIALEYLKKAEKKSFQQLKNDHLNDYHSFYNRVDFNLANSSSFNHLPTNIRLQQFKENKDLDLVSLYFQFGRYLLISSSRPGGQPANLQGIWNDKIAPPWDSKYTININTEMNYWPAEVTNLSEMHSPLFDMIADLAITGQESAKKMYNARGFNVHHNTDIWRISGIVDGGFYGMWPMGGAWLTQHIWSHYLYTGDIEFLKKYYPILKASAEFYYDVLQPEPDHNWLVVSPSISPENKYYKEVALTYGTTMDNQLVFDVFSNVIRASELLNTDADFRNQIIAKRNQLPPMQIGQHTQLQEWIKDWDKKEDKHRHISHLYGLHPSAQISPLKNPELFEAAENTLNYRGDKSTGWSMGWKVNFWARLLKGNRSYDLIKDQLTLAEDNSLIGGTYPNLLDAHPPFQIDGNFGCTVGIAEMLMQSHDGAIHLLPALPTDWKKGNIKGLKSIGGFELDLDWNNHNIKTVTIKSTIGGNLRVRSAVELVDAKGNKLPVAKGENQNQLFYKPTIKKPIVSEKANLKGIELPQFFEYDIPTTKGQIVQLKAKAEL